MARGINSRRFPTLPAIAVLALVYLVVGKLALKLAFLHASASPAWPPAGIALAALLLLGSRMWPGIFLGAFLVNFTAARRATRSIFSSVTWRCLMARAQSLWLTSAPSQVSRGIAIRRFGMNGDIERSLEAGFVEHLVKRVRMEKLEAAIDRVIAAGSAST